MSYLGPEAGDELLKTAIEWLRPRLISMGVEVGRCRFFVEETGPHPMVYAELPYGERMVFTDGAWRPLWRAKV